MTKEAGLDSEVLARAINPERLVGSLADWPSCTAARAHFPCLHLAKKTSSFSRVGPNSPEKRLPALVTLRPFNEDSAAAKRNRDQASVDASGHNERRSTE